MERFTPAQLEEAACRVAARHEPGRVRAALVAGSGINLAAPGWEKSAEIPYVEIFPFPILSLPGHTPTLSVWRRGPEGLLVFNGRFHLYQGYAAAETAAIPRLAGLLGAPVYLATNATGAIDPAIAPGSLVVVRDHLNLQGTNPLIGEWGRWRPPLFPDMSEAYDRTLRAAALRYARAVGFAANEGVYAGVLGPSFETPAEIEMLRRAGATVVGMSTVQEVIAARHLGMRVLVLSLATNLAAGVSESPLTHEEVLEVGAQAKGKLLDLVQRLLDELRSEAGP
ncbi:MAG: purine-nucleoside phosphorylase [Thermoanaerobaculaceae bacterium]|nr:purine-nucleoside phosphorylase [Thermoanaerobaculaceae bacterium]